MNLLGTGGANLSPGIWTAVTKTTNFTQNGAGCRIQVRAQSHLQVYYGFTYGVHNDVPAGTPVLNAGMSAKPDTVRSALMNQRGFPGFNNRMLAHVSNLSSLGTLDYVNLVVWEYYFNATIIGSAIFKPRVNCGYEWYSQTFQCQNNAFGLVVS